LLLTPCLRAIKARRPENKIILCYKNADHRDVFLHNPHIDLLAEHTSALPIASGQELVFEPAIYWPNALYAIGVSNVIAQLFEVSLTDDRPELFLQPEEVNNADRLLETLSRPIVAIHASSTILYKEWYPDRWTQVIGRSRSCTFIQLGRSSEDSISGAVDLRGTTLRDTFALLNSCDAFVGVDSGLAHAATAVGTPSVVLFGASNPVVFGHHENINLYEHVECSPCMDLLLYSDCPIGRICMQAISVESVHDALCRIGLPGEKCF